MKTVILAGGRGSRLSEMTHEIPKPMVQIGGKPMLHHIMGIYAKFGYNDFVIAGGYKIQVIDDWLSKADLPYKIQLVDTGLNTQTGGRVKRVNRYLDDVFMLTYGDGLTNENIWLLENFHRWAGLTVTTTGVRAKQGKGRMTVEGYRVIEFNEKPEREDWDNGGYMVCDRAVMSLIQNDNSSFEDVLKYLARIGEMASYNHSGYWHCVDTLRDLEEAEQAWKGGAPWA